MVIPTPGREAAVLMRDIHALLEGRVLHACICGGMESQQIGCTVCQMNQSTPPVAPLHPWS